MEGQVQSARALPHALRDGPITDYKRLKALTFLKKKLRKQKTYGLLSPSNWSSIAGEMLIVFLFSPQS